MLCTQCSKDIPNDSLFCPYCAAEQPVIPPEDTPPHEASAIYEPHNLSFARRAFGKIVGALLLLALAGLLYILSSSGANFSMGWANFNN